MNHSNIILTGLPRSGSTLVCHLLNKVNNTIALNEPMAGNFPEGATQQEICGEIAEFFASSRQSILEKKQVLTKHIKGKVPDNSFGPEKNSSGLRTNHQMERSFIDIENEVSDNFTLCVKHNGLFALLLGELTSFFPCYAIIRNPLAVLASWNSVDIPVNYGHIPVAENADRELFQALSAIPDRLDRQFHILSWFFGQYKNTLPKEKIIRYEEVIESGGSSLKMVTSGASKLAEPLVNRNVNDLYDKALMLSLGERLLNTEGEYWQFYTPEDVKSLLSKIIG
ncbi:hypothetical protein [Methylovulum psychrotolerans]|uniref:Sulfotransferase family protein n=1 Tax=Methylovulum psychrotolerans TaxID=1704499 RepID=A0A1Z4BXS9_9GAMM|nr:hypothetical protein [Methylovulum psychrotolerans]ASF46106.1 hypothetical protein CEK71_08440 [Methylovulum psychrotolerans]